MSATGVESALRADIRRALDAMDTKRFDGLGIWAGLNGHGELFGRVAQEELDRSAAVVKAFWEGPCDCCGSLN